MILYTDPKNRQSHTCLPMEKRKEWQLMDTPLLEVKDVSYAYHTKIR